MDHVNVNKYIRTLPGSETFPRGTNSIDNRRINQQWEVNYHHSNRLCRGAARIPCTAY
jgi:hypothetical protein